MKNIARTVQSVPLALIMAAVSSSSFAAVPTIGNFTPIFEGIDYATGSLGNFGINAMKIDLTDPNIKFYTSPTSATAPNEVIPQTTGDFLSKNGLQVAINANFFNYSPINPSAPTTLNGIAVSNGNVVNGSSGGNTQTVVITQSNVVSIVNYPLNTLPSSSDYNDVSGFQVLLNGALDTSNFSATSTQACARTAAGISQNSSTFYLMTIDGLPSCSGGATPEELVQALSHVGAYNAVNLDGGGSTTMVQDGSNGLPLLLNTPSGGSQRAVGNSLGVYALSLSTSVPEPATYLGGLVALGFGFLLRNKIKN